MSTNEFLCAYTSACLGSLSLRDNCIIVFGDFSGTFKIVSSQKTAKRKLVRHFLKLVFLKKQCEQTGVPNFMMVF